MYVNGDPVNLSDPTGHRYTTGCEDGGTAEGCFSSTAPPVMPCDVKHTCSQPNPGAGYYGSGFHQNPFASVQQAEMNCGQGISCADEYALDMQAQIEEQGIHLYIAALQYGYQEEQQQAEQARTCNNPLCGVTQALWGTLEGIGSLTNPINMQLVNKWLGAETNPWLAGDCVGSCLAGKIPAYVCLAVCTLGVGAIGDVGAAADAASTLETAADATEEGSSALEEALVQ